MDNGSSHRGQASVDRAAKAWPNLTLVHLPIHASWLNQIEIYFSIIQRKVLDPNDNTDLARCGRIVRDQWLIQRHGHATPREGFRDATTSPQAA